MVTISESIKQEIAARVVEQAHPGYDANYMGEWYVVNGTRLMHYQNNAQWTPWNDDDDVISVEDLVMLYGGGEDDNCDFWGEENEDCTEEEDNELRIAFALGYVPDSYDEVAYAAQYGE